MSCFGDRFGAETKPMATMLRGTNQMPWNEAAASDARDRAGSRRQGPTQIRRKIGSQAELGSDLLTTRA